jgi:nitronate monooxygenase
MKGQEIIILEGSSCPGSRQQRARTRGTHPGSKIQTERKLGMQNWPNRRILDLLKIEIPIIQAPMAGSDSVALARSVSSTGALGSLACALLSAEDVREAVSNIRDGMTRPFNLNFFCHTMTPPDAGAIERWKEFLKPHYERLGLDSEKVAESRLRLPFDEGMCAVVEELHPPIVSFHFGLPASDLVLRLKASGIKILSTATTVNEAKWLEARECDAIIAQGVEAGGHRGMFLETDAESQPGLFALLPQLVDAVSVPVIAAGGIADARGAAAAFALGASAVQLGTAYLFCPEANVSPLYRTALAQITDDGTVLTNLFSGRAARAISNRFVEESGPMSDAALPYPYAATLVAPLRAASEKAGSTDYMQMWAGQAARLGKSMPADEFTRTLAVEVLRRLGEGAFT